MRAAVRNIVLARRPPVSEVELIGTLIGTDAAASQLLTAISDFTDAAWTKTRVTAGAAALTETATTGIHEVTQTITKAASSLQYMAFVDVTAGLRTRIVMVLDDGTGSNGVFAVYDLSGVQIGVASATFGTNFSNTFASIQKLASGKLRCGIVASTNSTTSLKLSIRADSGSGTGALSQSYAGNAGSVAIALENASLKQPDMAILTDGLFTDWWESATSQAWAGIDLGLGKSARFTRYRFAPRPGDTAAGTGVSLDYETRMQGALAQASDDPTFAGGISLLDTIPTFPYYPRFQLNERTISGNGRAARVLMPASTNGSISDLKFFGRYGATTSARPVAPVISPWGGRFPSASQVVTITSLTRQASIYYTTDGTYPTSSSTLYTGPFTLSIGVAAKTLRAVAYDATLDQPYSVVKNAIFNPWGYKPAEDWYDDRGILVEAHGGHVIYVSGRYYWFGAFGNKQNPSGVNDIRSTAGVWLYSSTDLYNWRFEGNILPNSPDDTGLVRPHVIYNASTGKYVLWARQYGTPFRACVAQSSNITGPWAWVTTNINVDSNQPSDCNLFQDDDGTAYFVYAAIATGEIVISRLASDYLSVDGTKTAAIPSVSPLREAPVLFKRGSVYFLITSKQTAYSQTLTFDQEYIVNSGLTPLTAWPDFTTNKATLFAVDPAATSFNGQSTCVLKINGKSDAYMYLSDQWHSNAQSGLYASRQVWLPLTFADSTHVAAGVPASWDIDTQWPS